MTNTAVAASVAGTIDTTKPGPHFSAPLGSFLEAYSVFEDDRVAAECVDKESLSCDTDEKRKGGRFCRSYFLSDGRYISLTHHNRNPNCVTIYPISISFGNNEDIQEICSTALDLHTHHGAHLLWWGWG